MSGTRKISMPAMGEGVRRARVARILKNKGDWIDEDADIVEMETDKATIGVASPVSGYVEAVHCAEGDMVDVGAVMVEVRPRDAAPRPPGGAQVSPAQIMAASQVRKGMAQLQKSGNDALPRAEALRLLPDSQLSLIQSMAASQKSVITANVELEVDWALIDTIKKNHRVFPGGAFVPSSLDIFCWALAKAMGSHDKFRARLTADNALLVSPDCRIGIARMGEDDTLRTETISIGAELGLPAVADALRGGARSGAAPSVVVSDMSSLGIRRGQPVVIAPSVCTLLIGAPGEDRRASLVCAFDHKAINGGYAARFLRCISRNIHALAYTELETISVSFLKKGNK